MFNLHSIFSAMPFAMPLLYLDPGSGSFLIQLILAIGVGASVAIRLYWNKIKALFTGKRPQPIEPSDDTDEE